jgi:hypothetical protein
MNAENKFSVSEWVEVRSKEEIFRTLDAGGQLDGMPFMPEMLQFCGKRFRVYKSAHKTCDPDYRSRRIRNAVHLETRCDGQAHGGCQAGCLLFWKDAWLKSIAADKPSDSMVRIEASAEVKSGEPATGCTESALWNGTQAQAADMDGGEPAYICQTTQVQYEEPLKWWDLRQYIEDYWSGNIGLWRLVCGFVWSMYFHLSQAGIGVGPAMRWFYNTIHPLGHGNKWPRTRGTIPEGQPTPTVCLNLQPGELVRVRSHEEILATLNDGSKNHGLWWDAELVPYCGKTYRVAKRVHNVLDEKTGKMVRLKSPSILLESVICAARYSPCRMFCPRSTYCYWREIWLERVEAPPAAETVPSDVREPVANRVGAL